MVPCFPHALPHVSRIPLPLSSQARRLHPRTVRRLFRLARSSGLCGRREHGQHRHEHADTTERVAVGGGAFNCPFCALRKRGWRRPCSSFTGDRTAHTHHNAQAVCSPYPRLNTPRIKNTHEDCGIIVWSRHGALYGIATTLSEGAFLHVWLSAWLPRGTLTRDLHRFAHQVGRDGVLSHLWGRGPGAVVSTCMLIGGMAFFRTTTVGAHVLDFS